LAHTQRKKVIQRYFLQSDSAFPEQPLRRQRPRVPRAHPGGKGAL